MCDYKYNGISCVVETHSVSKLCSFHETELIFNEIKKQLDTILYERLPGGGYRPRIQLDDNQDIREIKEFRKVCQQVEEQYGRFYRNLDWANLEDYFYLFMCQKGSSLDAQNFYFPVKEKKIKFESKKNQEDKNDNSNIWQRELKLQNIKYYDFDKFKQFFDLHSYDSSKRLTYRDLYAFVYENDYGSSEFPNFIDFNNIVFDKDLTINLPEIYINLNNCKFNGNVTINAKSIYIKGSSNIIDKKINERAVFDLVAKEGIISISNSVIKKLNQIDIKSLRLAIADTVIEDINSKIDIETSFDTIYLSNKLILDPLFLNTKVDIYDVSSNTSKQHNDLTLSVLSPHNPLREIPQLQVPREFLTTALDNTGIIRNVYLKRLIFHDNSKQDNNYNPENLSKLSFVHCKFNDGHKLYKEGQELTRLEYNYRYLRKHYDEKGDYIEGNDFHYNYMEAKRKNTANAWDRFLLGLYEGLNGYNTKPEKTFWILVLLVLTSSLVIFCLGEFDIKDSTIYASKDNHHYAFSLLYAFSNLVPLINSDLFVSKNWVSVFVKLVENISSPILVTFLVMALRNRFRRSKSEDEFK